MIGEDKLIAKIQNLPPGKIDKVADFIDALIENDLSDQKSERYRLIAVYAAENGGTDSDLDHEFENAGIENLLSIDEASQ